MVLIILWLLFAVHRRHSVQNRTIYIYCIYPSIQTDMPGQNSVDPAQRYKRSLGTKGSNLCQSTILIGYHDNGENLTDLQLERI